MILHSKRLFVVGKEWTGKSPEKWEKLGLMGPYHTLTTKGQLVFNAPYATLGFDSKDDERSRLVGTIVQESKDGGKMTVATGNWQRKFVPNKGESFLKDPHTNDDTGNAMVQGNFYPEDTNSEHFAVGAPGANHLYGRVYICYKCFEPNEERKKNGYDPKDKVIEPDSKWKQTGARFGAALAAVNLNGDQVDDLVIGAPLFSDVSFLFKNKSIF